MAAAAQQRNFRFGEWDAELAAADWRERGGGNRGFVEIPEVVAVDALPVVAPPLERQQSSSSWTTVSSSSSTATAECRDIPRKQATQLGEVSAARETDILDDDVTTEDDELATFDDGRTVRETDIINDEDDGENQPTSGRDPHRRRPVPVGNADPAAYLDTRSVPQSTRRRGLPRSHSDTKLDAAGCPTSATVSAANHKNRRVKVVLSDGSAAPAGVQRDGIRRSASVKARPTGYVTFRFYSVDSILCGSVV